MKNPRLSAWFGFAASTPLLALLPAGCETAPTPPPPPPAAATLRSLAEETIYEVSNLDRPPMPIRREVPHYPVEMRRNGIQGATVVEFIVDTDGHVRDARAVEFNDKSFAQAAVESISGWKFSPGLKAGRPVNTRMRMPVNFTLGHQ